MGGLRIRMPRYLRWPSLPSGATVRMSRIALRPAPAPSKPPSLPPPARRIPLPALFMPVASGILHHHSDLEPDTLTDHDHGIITLLATIMDLRAQDSIDAIQGLYTELTSHGDTQTQAQDRIAALYDILAGLPGIRRHHVVDVLRKTPTALTALRYSGVAKEEAWEIILNHARRDWPSLPELLGDYRHYLDPGHSFNLRYMRSARAIRYTLKFNGFLALDSPATFVILDRFAEMGWNDDDVLTLVRAMTGAISTRNTWGFYRGYQDYLYNSHFQLLPPIVEALDGRNPRRRAAITAFIRQLTQDTGQWYLEHALAAIGLLAAQGRLASADQDQILAARAWELYVRQAHDAGIQIPDPTGTERAQFEGHFAYLFEEPFDLKFVKSLRILQEALPDHRLWKGNLDHPDAFGLWQDLQKMGWNITALTQLIPLVHQSVHLGTAEDNMPVVLFAATTAGALNLRHQQAAVRALEDMIRMQDPTSRIEKLQRIADFAMLPMRRPGDPEQHIDRIVQGIASSDFTVWREIAHRIGSDPQQQIVLLRALLNRVAAGNTMAHRALHQLPKIFESLEID